MNLRVILEGEVSPHDAAELAESGGRTEIGRNLGWPGQVSTAAGHQRWRSSDCAGCCGLGGGTRPDGRCRCRVLAVIATQYSVSLIQDGVGATVGNLSAKQLDELSSKLDLRCACKRVDCQGLSNIERDCYGRRIAFVVNALADHLREAGQHDATDVDEILRDPSFGDCDSSGSKRTRTVTVGRSSSDT